MTKKTKQTKKAIINIVTKHDNFNAFGGLVLVFNALSGCGLLECIDEHLGQRGVRSSSFSYSEIFRALVAIYLTGGDCLEDVEALREFWSRGERMPSPDVIGRALKDLAVGDRYVKSEGGHRNGFNGNGKLNRLLAKSARMPGLVDTLGDIVVDFDHQLIETECKDAEFGYKGFFGMFPGVAAIGGAIVYVENRDGNAPVRLAQHETLKRMFNNLEREFPSHSLVFRADAGSYSEQTINAVMKRCSRFYIRANTNEKRRAMYGECAEWMPAECNGERFKVASFTVDDIVEGIPLRLVVQRAERDSDGQPDLFGTQFVYRAIVTNDFDMEPVDVIRFYNQRGAIERNFDMQNNDFG